MTTTKRWAIAWTVCIVALMSSGCVAGRVETTVSGVYPRLPLPEKTKLVAVAVKRTATGIECDAEGYEEVVRMLVGLQRENKTLRETVEAYNRWAEEQEKAHPTE